MNYAFKHLEVHPYKNSWLGYIITQNGYPEDNQSDFSGASDQAKKFPLKVDYKMKFSNYDLLSTHETFREDFKTNQKLSLTIPVNSSHITLLRCPENNRSQAHLYDITMHKRRLTKV